MLLPPAPSQASFGLAGWHVPLPKNMVGSSPALYFVKTEHKLTFKKINRLFLKLEEEARPAFTLTYRATYPVAERVVLETLPCPSGHSAI